MQLAAKRLGTVCLITLIAGPAWSADYWVDGVAGNDANPGTQGQPWATLQRAVNQPVQPGDTVHVMDGTYVGFISDVDGTANAPITWKAEGANVVLNQPFNPPNYNQDVIRLEDADYNVIDGFELTASPRAGIAILGSESDFITGVVVRNCNAHDNTRWGIFDGFANDSLYEYNITSGSQVEHGIYHSNSGDNAIIRYNLVYGNNAAGLHNNGDASLGGDGICSNLLIEGNVIYQNGSGGGAAINMDGVQDSIIRNNLIYAASASGIIGYQIDAAAPAVNNVIVNNTVIMDDSGGRWALGLKNGSSAGCRVFNNVFYRNHSFRGAIELDGAPGAGFMSDYNVVVDRFTIDDGNSVLTLAQWQSATGQDANSMLIDPSTLSSYFVDPANDDWHLRSGSPAEDSGTAGLGGASAPALDYEQDPRPQGSGFDIGADELGTGGSGPVADFSGSPRAGAAPMMVQFTDLSTGTVTGWSWDFGDGNGSTAPAPSHSYANPGSYTVSLTVSGPGGSDTETKPGYVTVTGSNPIDNFLSGPGRGFANPNTAAIHSLGGTMEALWTAYGAGQWGTLVAASDIDDDGVDDALTGPGPGAVYGPQARAFQADGTAYAKVNFFAYGTLRYGVNVRGAGLDSDAPGEILTGAGPGAVFGPHVRGWNYDAATLTAIQRINFFAYSTLRFGVNVGSADVDDDGYDEILSGSGPSGAFAAQVRGFDYDGGPLTPMPAINFFAFSPGTHGVWIDGGDVTGDTDGELVAGRGPDLAQSPQIRGFDFSGAISPLSGFDTTLVGGYGARGTTGDIDGDGIGELVAGSGDDPASTALIQSYDYDGASLTSVGTGTFAPFTTAYGVVPATGTFGY